jgi:hypothetical protein
MAYLAWIEHRNLAGQDVFVTLAWFQGTAEASV